MASEMFDQDPLVVELKDAFLDGNGSPEEWEELVLRPELPAWAVQWMHGDDEERKELLDELFRHYLVPYTLVEIEVTNEDNVATGRALVRIEEAKVSASQHTARVQFLASTQEDFDDWANLHFNDLKDFDLHFCRKHPSGCKVKPRAAKMGWYHVGAFRVMTMIKAVEHGYMRNVVLEVFGEHLAAYMEEKEVNRRAEDLQRAENHKAEIARTAKAKAKLGEKLPGDGKEKPVLEETVEPAPSRPPKVPRFTSREQKDEKLDASRKARSQAEAAASALASSAPIMLEPAKVVTRSKGVADVLEVRQSALKGCGGGQGGNDRGVSFLDNISAPGSDDPYGGDKLPLKPVRFGDGGNGGGGRDSPPKDDRRKSRRSPSSSSKRPLRASKVIAPEKVKKRKRPGGDPSSDPESSGDGDKKKKKEDRKDKKKKKEKDEKKRHSRSPEKRRSRRRRSKKKAKSSSSRSSRSEDEIYGRETAKYESLMEKAKRHPGKLLRSGLEQMGRFMNARSGDDLAPSVSWREQRVNAYLNQVLFNQHPASSMGMRNARELVTLATCIDLLMEEQFASLGDVLMQRLKAVEASLSEGWSVANFQELIPPPKATLTTDQERAFAARHAIQQRKLAESVRRKSG